MGIGRVGFRRCCAAACALVFGAVASVAFAAPKEPSSETRLSLSLPEVVVESPNLERLIAERVRPNPPDRLGVRLPDVLVRPEVPAARIPPRPIPVEPEPDPDLTRFVGGFARFFGDRRKLFETGLAYFQRESPVEALSFFERAADKAREGTLDRQLRGASLFWAAETLERMGRTKEADEHRRQLVVEMSPVGMRYAAAARYALAERRCRAGDLKGCLAQLGGGTWQPGGFATPEANFLRAWALVRSGQRAAALDAWNELGSGDGLIAARALVAAGHLYFQEGEHAKALAHYLRAEKIASAGGAEERELLGEALYGIGWNRLMLGLPDEASAAFALLLRRHPQHPLRRSAELGALVARIEQTAGTGKPAVDKLFRETEDYLNRYGRDAQSGELRLQLAWALFRHADYAGAGKLAAQVSDAFPLGRVYRIARIIEGLSLYHQGEVRRAYGVLRRGAERPPSDEGRNGERGAARSAALATAFAAFRLKDFAGAQAVLEEWAFPPNEKKVDAEAALWYAEAAFEAGDLKRAARAFAKIPAGAKEHVRALAGTAWIYYRRREWKRAAEAFDAVFEADPRGALAAEALARAGEARFNQGDYAGALAAFQRVEEKYAGSDVAREALFQRGKLLYRRDRFAEARAAFQTYLQRYPRGAASDQVEFMAALIPFRQGNYAQARERLLDFIEHRRNSALAADAYLRLGDAAYNQGNYSEADRLYRLMMTRFPNHPKRREAAYGLILTRLQREEYGVFLSEARAYLDAHPDDQLSVALAFQVAEVFLTRGDLKKALDAYRDVVARYPSDRLAAQALLRISSIHRRMHNIDAALDTYESILERYGDSPLAADALFGMGETLASIGRCAEASVRLESFLKRYPSHDFVALAHHELGRCLARLGDRVRAIEHLRKVVEDKRETGHGLQSDAALLLAALYTKQGRFEEAERALGPALASPNPAVAAEALYAHADLRARRKDPGARAEFLKLTYRYPGQRIWVVRALARSGELYAAAGYRETALRIFQKMKEIAPPGEMRSKAAEAIRRLSAQPASRR